MKVEVVIKGSGQWRCLTDNGKHPLPETGWVVYGNPYRPGYQVKFELKD